MWAACGAQAQEKGLVFAHRGGAFEFEENALAAFKGGIGRRVRSFAPAAALVGGENHPAKSAAAIRARIDGGNEWLGVCVDTGWLGTQGVPAPQAVREIGALVRHTHMKDVKAAGAHATCLLGEGVVDVAGTLAGLMLEAGLLRGNTPCAV